MRTSQAQKMEYLLCMDCRPDIWFVIKVPLLHTFTFKLIKTEALVFHLKYHSTTAWGQAVFQGGKDVRTWAAEWAGQFDLGLIGLLAQKGNRLYISKIQQKRSRRGAEP